MYKIRYSCRTQNKLYVHISTVSIFSFSSIVFCIGEEGIKKNLSLLEVLSGKARSFYQFPKGKKVYLFLAMTAVKLGNRGKGGTFCTLTSVRCMAIPPLRKLTHLPALYLSTFQPLQRGFFSVHLGV